MSQQAKPFVQFLCIVNLVILVGLAALVAIVLATGIHTSDYAILDLAMFALAWSWLLATPIVAGIALLLNRGAGSSAVRWSQWSILALWLASVVLILLMPFGGELLD